MKRYACARCGKTGVADKFVYSSFTGKRYCRDNWACEKRHSTLKRAGKTDRGFVVAS